MDTPAMVIAANPGVSARPPFPRPAKPAAFGGDASLRELLRRCSPPTYEAACRLRATGDPEHLPIVLRGILERFVAPALRAKLRMPCDDLRLIEDLGIDSLTMMEIVSLAEDVFEVSIDNEDLGRLRTLGDIRRFIEVRLPERSLSLPARTPGSKRDPWQNAR